MGRPDDHRGGDDGGLPGLGRDAPGQPGGGAGPGDGGGDRLRRRAAGPDRRQRPGAGAGARRSAASRCSGAHKGFTTTHQAIADARDFGRGLAAAQTLERANLIVNKNLLPADRKEDWDYPGGLRIGTIEVTRFGMREREMEAIAELIARVLVRGEIAGERCGPTRWRCAHSFPTIYYCFEAGLAHARAARPGICLALRPAGRSPVVK